MRNLTDTLLCVKERVQFASLRIWFEEGELKFFLTNLPQRKGKRTPTYGDRPVDSPVSTLVDTQTVESHAVIDDPSTNQSPSVVPPPTNPRKRGRPPRKRPCVTSTPSSSSEQLRTLPSQEHTERINISNLSPSRDFTHVDIPCSNPFEALANLDEDEEDPGEGPEMTKEACYRKVLFCRRCPGDKELYELENWTRDEYPQYTARPLIRGLMCCDDCRKHAELGDLLGDLFYCETCHNICSESCEISSVRRSKNVCQSI